MPRDLRDKVIIITGASSGIGAATAIACARAGMHAVLNGRNEDALQRIADEVRQRGTRAATLTGDVTEPDLSTRLLDLATAEFSGFHAVFANAGYGFKVPFHELAEDKLRQIFEVNFFAACDLLQRAAQRLIAAGSPGHLLMCSSAVARLTMPAFGAYSASKAAQHHICRAARMDLRPHKIDVSSVHPIGTRTAFFDRAAGESGLSITQAEPAGGPAWLQQSPERVARAVVRCLRNPCPEVWTCLSVRIFAALATLFPRAMDLAGRVR